jgi:hypothetical protein
VHLSVGRELAVGDRVELEGAGIVAAVVSDVVDVSTIDLVQYQLGEVRVDLVNVELEITKSEHVF